MSRDPFRLTPPVQSEDDVEKACLDILRLHYKLLPIRLHSGKFRSMDGKRVITAGIPGLTGIPDYVIPWFFMETKATRGSLSIAQRAMHKYLLDGWGRETIVANSREALEAGVDDWLERHGRGG
jgi:hypothetical protein